MYKLSRLMLILSVVAGLWSLLIFAMQLGGLGYIGDRDVLFKLFVKRGYQALTAFGTARWANVDDLRAAGMLDANSGLIIGRVGGEWKAAISQGNAGAFQLLGVVERSVRAVPGVDSAPAQSEAAPGTGEDAEGSAYGGLRADGCWQGRVVRHSIPSGIRRVGSCGGLQRREFSADSRASAEGVRPPDRRTRSVQIGFAGPSDIQRIGLHSTRIRRRPLMNVATWPRLW